MASRLLNVGDFPLMLPLLFLFTSLVLVGIAPAAESTAADVRADYSHGQSANVALIDVLNNRRESAYVRCNAAGALARSNDRGALKTLLAILDDKSDAPEVRQAAIYGIVDIEGDQAVALLTRLAKPKDEHWRVRFWSAERLVRITDGRIDDVDLVASVSQYWGPGATLPDSDVGCEASYHALEHIAENGTTWDVRLAAKGMRHGVPSYVYEKKQYIIFPILAVLYYGLVLCVWLLCYRRRSRREEKKLWKMCLFVLLAVGIPLVVKAIYPWYPW